MHTTMLYIGIRNRLESIVSPGQSAESVGSGNVPVYATISMIGLWQL